MTNDDDKTERLLARGHPGGPRLDRIWDKVGPAIVVEERAGQWWRRMVMVLLPVVPVVAVVVLFVRPSLDSPWTARGVSVVPPQLEANCGTTSSPCRVGEPVFLRLMARHPDGVVYVQLLTPRGMTPLGGPLRPSATDAVPVQAQITPDADDVKTGIEVRATWLPGPVGGSAMASAIDSAQESSSVLHLMVVP